MTEYENACLTFMDIQGFKNLVLKTYPKDPMAIHAILKQFKQEQYIEPSDFSIKWCPEIVSFSDSIVRCVSNKGALLSADEIIINEVKALRLIQQRLIGWNPDSGGETGIFLRGGLTIGQAFINANENMVFGPAMIRAYELENVKNSPFRIVIDQAAVDAHARAFNTLVMDGAIAQDDDNFWFVDYFSVNQFRRWGFWNELERLQKVSRILQTRISNSACNAGLLSKYIWAAKRHNVAVKASKPLLIAMKDVGLSRDRLIVRTSD